MAFVDSLVQKKVKYCNLCKWQGKDFKKKGHNLICPKCSSSGLDRMLLKFFAKSIYTHRRLPALFINLNKPMKQFCKEQFQGKQLDFSEFKKADCIISHRSNSLAIIYLSSIDMQKCSTNLLNELSRVVAEDGILILHNCSNITNIENYFILSDEVIYMSGVVKYDDSPLLIYTKSRG